MQARRDRYPPSKSSSISVLPPLRSSYQPPQPRQIYYFETPTDRSIRFIASIAGNRL